MDQKYNDLKKTIKEPVEKWKKKQIFDFLNAMEFPAKDHSIYLQEFEKRKILNSEEFLKLTDENLTKMGMKNGFHRKKIIQYVDFFNGRIKNDVISRPKSKPEEEEKKMANPNIFRAAEQEEDGIFPLISKLNFIEDDENQNAIRIVRKKKPKSQQKPQAEEINQDRAAAEQEDEEDYDDNNQNAIRVSDLKKKWKFEGEAKQKSSLYQSSIGSNLPKHNLKKNGSKEEGDLIYDYEQPRPQIQAPVDKTMKFNKVNKKSELANEGFREERNLKPNYEQATEQETKKYKKSKKPEVLNMIPEDDDPRSEYTSNFEDNLAQINNNKRREQQANVNPRHNGMPRIEEEENSVDRRSIQITKKFCHKLIVHICLKKEKEIEHFFVEDFSIGTDKTNGLVLVCNPKIGIYQDIGETHCLVKINPKGIFELEDCGSEFGTFYKLNSNQKYLLEEEQIYQIGQTLIKIKSIDEKLTFEVLEGKNVGEIIEVNEKEFTFGSKKKNNFYIKNDKLLSAMHCYFKKKESGGFSIIDNSSTNGTWKKINEGEKLQLVPDLNLKLGSRTILYIADAI